MTEQRQGPAQVSNPGEPYVHSGGKQEPGSGIEMPPYDDRQKAGKSQDELAADPQRGGPGTSDAGPRQVSQAEREGVSATDTTAASPLGAGESLNKQGNERMVGKSAAAHESDQKDAGVGGQTKNIDPASPEVLTGDQGG
ncbi:MAG: hypothetical protein ACRDRO_15185 [Pseudonocardiaceae bacterium]